MRVIRTITGSLMAVAVLASAIGGTPAIGQSDTVFHLPFPCREEWRVSTREDHSALGGNGYYATDWNHYDADGLPDDAGRPVLAGADSGTVITVDRAISPGGDNYGNHVIVRYGDGPGAVELLFAHLASVSVREGQTVDAQTQIGTVGTDGLTNSSAHHLHYEQRVGDRPRPLVIEGDTWSIGAWDDPTVEITDDKNRLRANPAKPHTSQNCGSDTSEHPSVAPAVQWIEPVDDAKVGPSLQLSAWPTPVLVNGQLADPTDVSRVDFRASWSGGSAAACSATSADTENLWSCTADLMAMGVPAGPVVLTFNVLRTDGSTLAAPDGSETVTYGGGSANVVWVKKGTTNDASHVPFGQPVTLVTRFHGDVDVAEVRFTAYYPDWPNAKDAAKLPGFDPKATWRTLKVCRPKTKGCSWDGDRRAATVTYTWDPTVGEQKRSIQGVPKADPAISLASTKCVPVTLGVDAVDATGTTTSAPGGKIAQRCDAKAKGLARTVYLDPLAPPVAPGGVTLQCKYNLRDRGVKWCETKDDGPITLVWRDLSDDEEGFNIYARYVGTTVSCDPGFVAKERAGPWTRVGSVATGTRSWRVGTTPNTLPRLPRPKWLIYAMEFRVGAYNRAGESSAAADAKVGLHEEIFCGP